LSRILPLKEKARARIVQIARELKPYFPEITAAWRAAMFEELHLDGRAMAALERLNLGTGFAVFCQSDFQVYTENLHYYGARLGKLNVDTRAVARSLEIYQSFCEPLLGKVFHEWEAEACAAIETFSSAAFVTVSGAYFDIQKKQSAALLAVLDAELNAPNLTTLLEQVLRVTAETFGASIGLILLRDERDEFKAHAAFGLNLQPGDIPAVALGQGFSGQIAGQGEDAILQDVGPDAVLDAVFQDKAKALWGAPLKVREQVTGVLTIGFPQPYNWLPAERELLRAIAERSALAIERAQSSEAVREREIRIAELSGHLLRVQEEERTRISRELHDETGQALMVIRLYLGMLESSFSGKTARGKIHETLAVVDRTIEGIRRIIARLSPLVLQELGLVAAIRKEAKDLTKTTGIRVRVLIADGVGRLAPETETAIYRVVQEALHNVAKHAQARTATVQMSRENGAMHVLIEDDGQGMAKTVFTGRSFGLAGMRERVGSLGGVVRVKSVKGKGTRVEVDVPAVEVQKPDALTPEVQKPEAQNLDLQKIDLQKIDLEKLETGKPDEFLETRPLRVVARRLVPSPRSKVPRPQIARPQAARPQALRSPAARTQKAKQHEAGVAARRTETA
jgi:signal transduction histidine kinase